MPRQKKEQALSVAFVNEEDRQTFCKLFSEALKTTDVTDEILKKAAKKRSFAVKREVDGFKDIGIDPEVKFHFRKVRNLDEYDLDIEVKRLNGTSLPEYFDVAIAYNN